MKALNPTSCHKSTCHENLEARTIRGYNRLSQCCCRRCSSSLHKKFKKHINISSATSQGHLKQLCSSAQTCAKWYQDPRHLLNEMFKTIALNLMPPAPRFLPKFQRRSSVGPYSKNRYFWLALGDKNGNYFITFL